MSKKVKGFHRLLISRFAREQQYGTQVVETFKKAGLAVFECQDDIEVIQNPASRHPSTLVALFKPSFGWISKAEHGTLATRVGEHYLHPITGCRSACSYCYLEAHPQGRRPLHLYVGFEDLIRNLDEYVQKEDVDHDLLFCTGELADSLAEVDLYPVAPALVREFASRDNIRLELRTKSDKVEKLLDLEHCHKTTIAFSISPQLHVIKYEPGTASLEHRLRAARLCQEAGYPIALKFEPLILMPNWKQLYEETLRLITALLFIDKIHHISIGCLRWSEALGTLPIFSRNYKTLMQFSDQIEYRPGKYNSTITRSRRLEAYLWMRQLLRRYDINTSIWWSLEEPKMIEKLKTHKGIYDRDC